MSGFKANGTDLDDIFSYEAPDATTSSLYITQSGTRLNYRTKGSRHNITSPFTTGFKLQNTDFSDLFEQEIIHSDTTGTYNTDYFLHPLTNGCLIRIVNSMTLKLKIGIDYHKSYIVAGGGGGGGSRFSNAGGGGGGGGVEMYNRLNVTAPINKFEVTIGTGGSGSDENDTNSANGGDTSFKAYTTADLIEDQTTVKGGGGGGSGKENGKNGANGGGGGSKSTGSHAPGVTTYESGAKVNFSIYARYSGFYGQHSSSDNGAGGGGGASTGGTGTFSPNGGAPKQITISPYTFYLGAGGGGGGAGGFGGGTAGTGGANGAPGTNDDAPSNAPVGVNSSDANKYYYGGGGGGGQNQGLYGNGGSSGAQGCVLIEVYNSNVTFI